MKKNPFIPFLIGFALVGAVFSGCGDVDPANKGEKSTEAELESLSVGGLNAAIPTAISGALWSDTAQTLSGLAAKYTKTIEFPAEAAMSNLTLTPVASKNAKAEYATSGQPNTRPSSFNPANTAVTLNPPRYLYIKVTAEDGKTVNYYRFYITQEILPVPATGITLDKDSLSLTIHSSEKLSFTMQPETATNRNVTWRSSDPDVVSVDEDGIVTAKNFSSGGGTAFTTTPATGTATITATTEDGGFEASIIVTATMAGQVNLTDLPPLKDKFANYFMIGNIYRATSESTGTGANAVISSAALTRHFNALTGENLMKPSYLVTGYNASTGAVTWNTNNRTNADNFVDAGNNSGMKVIGHTLLWHSQNSSWMTTSGNATLAAMKAYITAVVSRYAGRIYSWDVLNEVFPDGVQASANWRTSMRTTGDSQNPNPWFVVQGADFVYQGFLAARLADPNAILYYNDYNMDSVGKSTMVRNMVRDVNAQYLESNDKPAGEDTNRLLIEGIGMQSHHNHSVTAAQIRASIALFRPLGVRLSVTELDVIAYPTYNDYSNRPSGSSATNTNVTNNYLLTQAQRYGEYMQVFLENADIIERVSLWGVLDTNSWRQAGLPLLFSTSSTAKPAYYRFVGALDEFEQRPTDE